MNRPYKQAILLVLVLVAAAVGTILAYTLFHSWYTLDHEVKEVRFAVAPEMTGGFDLNRSALTFGKVPMGGGGTRRTTIISSRPAIAYVRVDPSLAQWLAPNETRVVLDAGKPKEIAFNLDVPQNATPGNYTGYVDVLFLRRMPWD